MWGDVARLVTAGRELGGPAVALDVGAYQGDTVARIEALSNWTAIHAFEPFPASFDALCKRFKGKNGVVLHNLAVSDQVGTAELVITSFEQSNSLLKLVVSAISSAHPHQPIGRLGVNVTTLDVVAAVFAAARPA